MLVRRHGLRGLYRLSVLFLALAVPGNGLACRESDSETHANTKTTTPAIYDPANDLHVNPPSLSTPPPADRTRIADNEVLYACMRASPSTLNPLFTSSLYDRRLEELLYDRPFSFDARLEWFLNESMAESYQEAPDHRTAILKLKEGLTWHDGNPYTAQDIVFSWQQILDDAVPCAAAKSGTDQITDCLAVDDRTVKFTFVAPMPTNKWNVNFPVIPKHIYQKGKAADPSLATSDRHNRLNRNPIGNGPYRFVKWVADDRIVLDRWDGYHGKRPYFRRIVLRIIPDDNARMAAFLRQEIDEMFLSQTQFLGKANSDGFWQVGVKAYAPQSTYYYIEWNMDGSNPFFGDRRVRIAMSHTLNHDRVSRQVFKNLNPRSHGLFHPSSPMYHPDTKLYSYDPERAAALLDAAGWLRDANDGWRYKLVRTAGRDVRTKFSFAINLALESKTSPLLAAVLKEDLEKIGVELKLRTVEWAAFRAMRNNHDFQAHYSSWGTPTDPDELSNIVATAAYEFGRNFGGYANTRVDELLETARRCFDEPRRRRYYAELSKIFYEDAGYTFLVNAPTLWGFNKRLRGVTFSPRGPSLFSPGVLDWWVPKELALHDSQDE